MCDARAQVAAVSDDTVTVARVQTAAIENTLDDNNQALVDALNANNALVAGHLDQVADRVLLLVNTLVNLTRPPLPTLSAARCRRGRTGSGKTAPGRGPAPSPAPAPRCQ